MALLIMLGAGCAGTGGGAISSLTGQAAATTQIDGSPDQISLDVTGEVLTGSGNTGVSAIRYCGTSDAELTISVEAVDAPDGATVRAGINGNVTDMAAVVAVPDNEAVPVVDWDPALAGRFLTMAVMTVDGLELSLAGLRRTAAEEVSACLDPSELEVLLADRWELTGDIDLCTVHWDGVAADERASSTVIDARRRTSILGQVDPVAAIDVRAVDGQYEIGWALKLTADYNQDGEVGAMDLTPLGILYGLKATDSGWLSSAMERVDGNGDGAITSADISPLGQDYGNQCFDYRVEKSAGDAGGPGTEWTTVAECGRSQVTQYGDAVTSTGSSPYQRVLDDAAPGWMWYRVVAIAGSGTEAEPSPAVLAPDLTPPEWPDPTLTIDDEYYFYFDATLSDDRGETELAMEIVPDLDGAPDTRVTMVELNSRSSIEPITSPYSLQYSYNYYENAEDEEPIATSIYYRLDRAYHARLKVRDTDGNLATSNWVSFEGYSDRTLNGASPDLGTVWVNREGTVRFTPTISSDCGQGEILVRTINVPRNDYYYYDYTSLEDFAGAETLEYTGGEVILDHAVAPGEVLALGMSVESLDGSMIRFEHAHVFYPHVWFKPFEDEKRRIGFHYIVKDYLPRPEPEMPISVDASTGENHDESYMHFLEGGTDVLENISSMPDITVFRAEGSYPAIHALTRELLFWADSNLDFSVYWFKRQAGFSGHSLAPEGVFSYTFGNLDYVGNWVGRDDDLLAGIRCKPQDAGNGAYGLEVWEAPRNGEMTMREMIFPYEGLTDNDRASILDYRDGRYVVKLEIVSGSGLFGFVYDDYYAFQEEDYSWTVSYGEELPEAFDSSPWENWQLDIYTPSEETCYLHVYAYYEDEEENKTSYNGMYRGDLKDGLAGFELMYEFRTDELLDGQYPLYQGIKLDPLYPMDGSMFIDFDRLKIHADGSVEPYFGNVSNENFNELQTGWIGQDYRPVYANGLISDDGEWLACGREGVWGLAYWRELPEL